MKKSYSIMKRYCLWLVPALLMLGSLNHVSAQTTYYSKSTGTDFSDPAAWGTNTDGTGTSPSSINSLDSFVVRNNASMTLNSSASVRGLNIVAGTLTISSNVLAVERTATKTASFRVTGGTLTISGGTLNVYGSVLISSGVFNMSSGAFNVDANNNDAPTSVPVGTRIFEIASAVTGTVNGGVITIVDPHFGTATTQTFAFTGSVAARSWAGNTLRLGDGFSTDASSSTRGFELDCYTGSSRLTLGTVEVNGGNGTNRFGNASNSSANGTFVTNLVINSGSEFRNTTTANFHVEGDITNEGTLTVSNTLKLIKADGSAAVSIPQTISGSGVFRNSTTTATANFASLTINNSNATGVTFANANSLLSGSNTGTVSGTLTLTSGYVHASLGFVLGTATAAGTLSGGSATAYIDGPFTRTFASSRTASGTYTATTLFPVGKTAYRPIWIDPTTTSGGPVQLKAEAFETNSGFGGTGVSSVSQRRWEASIVAGTTNFTGTYLQLGDGTNIVSSNKIIQSTGAAGAYDMITPSTLFTSGTPNTIRTTGSQITAANFYGYFSYGDIYPCVTPADQPSNFTVSELTSTTCDITVMGASSSPTGYLVVRYSGASPVVTAPVNGTTYALSSSLGAGTVVVSSAATGFNQLGLTANTTYTYYFYAYNASSTCFGPQYNTTSPLIGSFTTCATIGVPTAQAGKSINTSSFVASWTRSTTPGVTYLLDVATTSTFVFGTYVPGYEGVSTIDSSYVISGLTDNTTYYYRVRAYSGSCNSQRSSTITVQTTCFPLAALPYTENFDGATTPALPGCTSREDVNNDATTWTTIAAPTSPVGYTGNTLRYSYNTSNAANDWFYTRAITLTGGTTYRLTFNYSNNSVSTYKEKLKVAYGTSATAASMTTVLMDSPTVSGNVYRSAILDFTPASSGDYYVGFQAYSIANQDKLYIDNIRLDVAPLCSEPTVHMITNVTSASATLRWNVSSPVPSNGYEFYRSTSNVPPTIGTMPSGNTTDTFAVMGGLLSNTKYYAWVRSNCGGLSSNWTAIADSFTTNCDPAATITEGFDTVSVSTWPACWKKVGSAGSANLQTGSNFSAPNCLYIYASSTASLPVVSLPPVNNAGAGTHWLKLRARANLTVGGVIQVGYLTNPDDAATFVPVTSFTASALTYNVYSVDLGTAPGSYEVLAIRHTGSPANSVLIDDVSWEAKPLCMTPTGVRSTLITSNSATSYWNRLTPAPGSGYDFYISTSNTAPTSLTTPSGNVLTDTFVSHGVLPGNTKHFVWVRSNCGSMTSDWSAVADSFTTLCDPVTSLPYFENFNSVTTPALPACTKREDVNNDGTTWTTVAAPTGYSGNTLRYSYSLSNAANDWFYTNGLSLSGGTSYRLTFNYGNNSVSTYKEKLKVAYGTSATATSMTTVLMDSPTVSGNVVRSAIIDFTPATGGIYYIGFQAYSIANQDKLYIDDVKVEITPLCSEPLARVISNITNASALLKWNAPSSIPSAGYQYYISTNNVAPLAGTLPSGTVATDTFTTLNLLSGNTRYYVWMRSDCGVNGVSSWTSVADSFTTACDALTVLPWTENFDALTTVGTTYFPGCWKKENGDWATSNITTSNFPRSGANFLREAYTATNEFIWTPGFTLTAGTTYEFSFYVQGDGNYSTWDVDVFYNSSQNAAGATKLGATYDPPANRTYVLVRRLFIPASTGTYYFSVRVNEPGTSFYYLGFDDFKLDVKPCVDPTPLTTTNVTNAAATLRWNAAVIVPSGGYDYYFGTSNTTPASPIGNVTDTFVNIGGLSENTLYYTFIRSNCGVNGTTDWSVVDSFTTACNPSTTLPFFEDFNSVTTPALPVCTKREDVNGDGTTWTTLAAPTTPAGFTGNVLRYSYNTSNAANDWFYINGISLSAGTSYRLTFNYANSSAATYKEKLKVAYGTSASANAMVNILMDSPTVSGSVLRTAVIDFTPASSGAYYIGFQAYSIANQDRLFIDNIRVDVSPVCSEPLARVIANVTNGGAALRWKAPSSVPSSGYEYYISTSNVTPVTGTLPSGTIATDTFTNIGGLMGSTKYYVWMRSNCGLDGKSVWTGVDSFTTLCDPVATLPWTEDFDALTTVGTTYFPGCWKKENGDWATSNVSTSNFPRSGANFLREAYTATNEYIWTPGFTLTAGTAYEFSFYAQGDGNYTTFAVDVFYNTTQSSGGATKIGGTYNPPANRVYTLVKRAFVPATTGVYYFAVRVNEPGTSFYYLGFDDFKVEAKTCVEPSAVTITDLTSAAATIRWTPAVIVPSAGYEYYLSTSPTTPTAGTIPTGTGITDTFVNVGSLLSATKYYVWIRGNCGVNGLSTWKEVADSFTTLCSSVTTITENFDGVSASTWPVCWKKVGTTGTANLQTTTPSSSPNCMYIYASGTTSLPVVAMPPVSNAGAGTHWLKLKARANFTVGGVIEVGYLTNPEVASTFVSVTSFTATALTYNSYTIDLGTAPGTNQVLAFRHTGAPANSVLIDDVSWEAKPACMPVPGVKTTLVTNVSATTYWTKPVPAPANGYDYYINTNNTAPTIGTTPTNTTMLTDSFVNHTGLTPNTKHFVWVRANCGSGTLGDWTVIPDSFTTACNPLGIPYNEDFNSAVTPALPSCATREDVNNDAKTWTTIAAPAGFTGNTLRYEYSSANVANDWFYTGGLSLTAGTNYRLTFNYGNNSTTYVEKLKVAYGTSAANSAMTVQLLDFNSVAGGTVQAATVDFVPPSTGVYYIGFKAYSDANQYYLYLDNISVNLGPVCAAPSVLSVTGLTSVTATLNISPLASATGGYEYYLSTSNVAPTAGTLPTGNITSGTTIGLSGLAVETAYYVWLRSNCGSGTLSDWSATPTTFITPVTAYPYSQNFDGVSNGWTTAIVSGSLNPWVKGTPAKTALSSAFSAPNAWVTGLTANYGIETDAALVSPTFDFSSMTEDPVLRFYHNIKSENNYDGGVLEISVNNGVWRRLDSAVGTGTGFNTNNSYTWYNNNSTNLTPGRPAWSGNSGTVYTGAASGWVRSATRLTGAAGNSNVRFRFRFVCDDLVNDEGWAIDNIEVFQLDAPASPASSVNVSGNQNTQLSVSWTNGGASGRIVVARKTTDAAVAPLNWKIYAANAAFKSGDSTGVGNYVVYAGTGSNVVVTGLALNTNYTFDVYEFNGELMHVKFAAAASSAGSTLPVKLLSFTGKRVNNDASLTWITASETNNKGFEVERSLDGKNFTFVKFVEGALNSNVQLKYNATDEAAFAKTNSPVLYYRLKQVDVNGKFAYSNIVKVTKDELAQDNQVITYPNPFVSSITVSFSASQAGTANISIVDFMGKTVYTATAEVKAGNPEIAITQLDHLKTGVYMMQVSLNNEVKTVKVVKSE